VIPLRATALIDAPPDTVARVLRRADVWTRTARAVGVRARVLGNRADPCAPLQDGDLIAVSGARWARTMMFRVREVPGGGPPDGDERLVPPTLDLVDGDGGTPLCRIRLFVAGTPAGTLTTVDVQTPVHGPGRIPVVGRQVLRRRVLRAERTLLGIAAVAADEVTVVVAGAVVHDRSVLAARRTRPASLAGRWELPGGKAEPGERETDALVRELREELALDVDVLGRIGPDVDLGDRTVLRCLAARPAGDPSTVTIAPTEHDQLRWLTPDELDAVDWLDADRVLLPHLRALLDGGTQ